MKEIILSILYLWKSLEIKDLLDIFIVFLFNFFIIYFIFRSYAWRILGLIFGLIGLYYLIKIFNLPLANIYFNYLLSFGVLITIIIFQKEIRRFIENLNLRFFRKSKTLKNEVIVENIIKALEYFFQNKIGCLLVFKNKDDLQEKIHNGVIIHGHLTTELLISIFQKNSPLHDGATIIDQDRIKLSSAILPLSNQKLKNSNKGTRHRAGLGITEESDAFSIIVSEETGEISYAENGKIIFNVSLEFIKEKLLNYYKTAINFNNQKLFGKIFNLKIIAPSLILATFLSFSLWTIINIQKVKIQKIIYVPVNFKNLKENLYINYLSTEKVKIVLWGYNYDLDKLKEKDLQFIFDLKDIDEGNYSLPIKEASINLPPSISIVKTEPEIIKLRIETKNDGNR